MAVEIARGVKFEVQSTTAAAITITAIAKEADAEVTATAHGLSNGAIGVLTDVVGMVELNGQIVRVANVATNAFDLEDIDTTGYSTFISGTFVPITAWLTLAEATSVNFGSVSANRKDASTLLTTYSREYLAGLQDTPEISVGAWSNPFAAALIKVEAAAVAGSKIGFRLTTRGGSVRLFRGEPTIPTENFQFDEIIGGGFGVTQERRRLSFAS